MKLTTTIRLSFLPANEAFYLLLRLLSARNFTLQSPQTSLTSGFAHRIRIFGDNLSPPRVLIDVVR